MKGQGHLGAPDVQKFVDEIGNGGVVEVEVGKQEQVENENRTVMMILDLEAVCHRV